MRPRWCGRLRSRGGSSHWGYRVPLLTWTDEPIISRMSWARKGLMRSGMRPAPPPPRQLFTVVTIRLQNTRIVIRNLPLSILYHSSKYQVTRATDHICRQAYDTKAFYEKRLEQTNNLYMELSACMLQLEKRERDLSRYDSVYYLPSLSRCCRLVYIYTLLSTVEREWWQKERRLCCEFPSQLTWRL